MKKEKRRCCHCSNCDDRQENLSHNTMDGEDVIMVDADNDVIEKEAMKKCSKSLLSESDDQKGRNKKVSSQQSQQQHDHHHYYYNQNHHHHHHYHHYHHPQLQLPSLPYLPYDPIMTYNNMYSLTYYHDVPNRSISGFHTGLPDPPVVIYHGAKSALIEVDSPSPSPPPLPKTILAPSATAAEPINNNKKRTRAATSGETHPDSYDKPCRHTPHQPRSQSKRQKYE